MPTALADTAPSIAEVVDRHLSDVFALVMSRVPSAAWEDRDGLRTAFTGLPHPLGNVAWNANLGPEVVESRIDGVIHSLKQRQVPGAWIVGPTSQPSDLGDRLLSRGFILADRMPGMILDLNTLQAPPVPAGVEILEVRDLETLDRWTHVLSEGYDIPLEIATCFSNLPEGDRFTSRAPLRVYLALHQGRPVACSMLYSGSDLAGVYCVATVPDARRKGIGAAVTAAPLLDARDQGLSTGLLHATPLGEPVYRRLGFQEVCTISLYAWVGG